MKGKSVEIEDTVGRSHSEAGAFLLLAALVLIVLFAFIAIAIDSARTLTSMTEKISTADAIALGALDAYLNEDLPTPAIGPAPTQLARHVYKWGKAKDRVVTYANGNKTTFIDGAANITLTDINGPSGSVQVTPGRWWTERPASCGPSDTGCPCDSVTGIVPPLNRPCFQPCSETTGCVNPSGVPGDLFASAMEVKLNTVAEGGVKTLFAKVLGVSKFDVEGRAYSSTRGSVSYALPQVGVLLFDLSRAMTMDNYLPYERNEAGAEANADRMEYSFPLSSAPAMGCSATGIASTCRGSCPVATGLPAPFVDNLFNEYTNVTPTTPVTYDNAKWDKYKCYSGSLGGINERHLVATGVGSRPAEPYSTLLAALNTYLVQYKAIGRAGDKLMLLGFDSQDLPERHFPPALPSGNAVFLSPSDTAELDALILMTSSPDEAAKKMFFPRATAKLDLGKALTTAAGQILTTYPTAVIDPYINLYSNGFALCGNANPASYSSYCANLTPSTASAVENMKHYEKQITILDEALAAVGENFLKPNGIRTNVLMGNVNMPAGTQAIPAHNALIGHWTDNKCATDLDFRRRRYMYVLPYPKDPAPPAAQTFRNRMMKEFADIGKRTATPLSDGGPTPVYPDGIRYVQPTLYMYGLAAVTLGQYLPLRPECATISAASADADCTTTRLGSMYPSVATRISQTRADAFKPAAASMELDAEGRLNCEPTNGPKSQFGTIINTFAKDITQSRLIMLVTPD